MKRFLTICCLLVFLGMTPLKVSAQEITITQEQVVLPSGGYTTLITSGIAGVVASAGLLLLSNRRGL